MKFKKNKTGNKLGKMIFFKPIVVFLIILIVVVTVFIGFKETEKASLSFGYYSFLDFEGVVKSIVSDFGSIYPNVNVNYETGILPEDYREWLYSKFLTGEEPDIFLIESQDLSTLVSKNMLMDLSNYIDKSSSFSSENYYNNLLDSGEFDGKIYALPIIASPQLLCVNKTLLEKVGIPFPNKDWTWSDFHQICRKLEYYNLDGNSNIFGSTGYSWLQAAYSNGIQPFSKGGNQTNLTNIDFINSVNYTYRLTEMEKDQIATEKDFEKGNVAFMPISTQRYLEYSSYPGKIEKLYDFDCAIISMPAGPNGDNISQEEVLYVGISPRTVNKKLSWNFLEFISTNHSIQRKILDTKIGFPVIKDLLSGINNEELLAYILEKGQPIYKFQSYDILLKSIEEEINIAYNNQKKITLSLKELYIKIDKALKK